MSYCFHPGCQNPQNPSETKFCQSCGSKLLLTPSSAIEKKSCYRGISLIGEGGFGRTFLAIDEENPLKQRCVIKQFLPQGSTYSAVMPLSKNYDSVGEEIEETKGRAMARKAVELFDTEAMQLEILGKHPQIPQLLGHFQLDGNQYLVQEYIPGKNLAQELAETGAFSEDKIRKLLDDLLGVLQFIHKYKVIHRDIKPENIIRRSTLSGNIEAGKGQLVLVDFGAAKVVQNSGLPKTGTVIGSAAYTAPEQLMGKAVFASDIYSLGVTCIHLLTQVPPFDLFDSRENEWVWRDYLKTPVSEELGRILDKMLAGATGRRYHSTTAIIRQLNTQESIYMERVHFSRKNVSNTANISRQVTSLTSKNSDFITSLNNQYRLDEIRQELQKCLADHRVKIKVTWGKKQLTVVINRDEDNPIDYQNLSQLVASKLTQLQVSNLQKVKLLGKVKGKTVPEWQQVLKVNTKAKFINQINRIKKHEKVSSLSKFKTKDFWLARFQERDFWMDSLMFGLVWFIFGYRIVVWHPLLSILIASAFIWVKNKVSQDRLFARNNLLATVAVLFLLVGVVGGKILVTGIFGILLACLFVALPLFYVTDT